MTTSHFALVAFVLWIAVIAVHAEGFSLPSTPPNQPPSSSPSINSVPYKLCRIQRYMYVLSIVLAQKINRVSFFSVIVVFLQELDSSLDSYMNIMILEKAAALWESFDHGGLIHLWAWSWKLLRSCPEASAAKAWLESWFIHEHRDIGKGCGYLICPWAWSWKRLRPCAKALTAKAWFIYEHDLGNGCGLVRNLQLWRLDSSLDS